MVYTIETLPGEPIIIDWHGEPLEETGHQVFAEELAQAVQSIDGPIYRIADLTGMSYSFPTMVYVMAEETRHKRPGSVGDPRIKTVLVATGEIASLVATAAKQPHYGALDLPVFETRDEALAYIRKQIQEGDADE
jgi:hypothetical protein